MTGFVEKAVTSWDGTPPDWVRRLAEEADATSQNRAAKRIGYSGGVVHGVLGRSYKGSYELVEERVRGSLMQAVVACPALGEIGTHVCRDWRDRAKRFSSHNALSVRMYRACRRCPRFTREAEE